MSFNVIAVDVRRKNPKEGIAGGAIYPGFLIQPSASKWIAHAVSGGSSDFVADYLMEESIADAYADTELMPYFSPQPGDIVNCYLTTSQTVAKDDKITSNGDGYVKEASSGAIALGGSTNYITFTPVGNKVVEINFIDPKANTQSLSVDINGNCINVYLATDGSGVITSTPALIEAAIQVVSGYDDLVSTADTGTGAVTADSGVAKADEVFGYAAEAVTTTSDAARLLVRKGA